jgi:hypothetical protein
MRVAADGKASESFAWCWMMRFLHSWSSQGDYGLVGPQGDYEFCWLRELSLPQQKFIVTQDDCMRSICEKSQSLRIDHRGLLPVV